MPLVACLLNWWSSIFFSKYRIEYLYDYFFRLCNWIAYYYFLIHVPYLVDQSWLWLSKIIFLHMQDLTFYSYPETPVLKNASTTRDIHVHQCCKHYNYFGISENIWRRFLRPLILAKQIEIKIPYTIFVPVQYQVNCTNL